MNSNNQTTDTRIARIEYRIMNIPLREPFRFATNTLTVLPYAWIKIQTENGEVGFGEAPTYWDPTGETQLAAIGAFQLWEPLLIGKDVFAIRDICAMLERTAAGAYAARCGVETALLDIVAKLLNVPATTVLGGIQSQVTVNAVIGLPDNSNDTRLQQAVQKIQAGSQTVKIKSSYATFEQDLALVRSIRKQFDSVRLFVDANQSWGDAYSARVKIEKMAAAGVDWIEQPIDARDRVGQWYLYQTSPLPVMLDEGVMDYVSLADSCNSGTIQYANLKLAKAGGPFSAMKFITVAEAYRIPYAIGSMVESGLGMLANYQVARASRPLTCDFDAYSLVDDGLDVGFVQEGEYVCRKDEAAPGLGYDQEQMERVFASGTLIGGISL